MEMFNRFVLTEDGDLKSIQVPKKVALKEIDEIIEEDKEFLEIMEKM